MTLALGAARTDTVAGRLNPVTKVCVLLVLSVPLLISIDLVTSAVIALVEVLALPLLGLGGRTLLRLWPVGIALAGVWLANWLISGSVAGLAAVSVRLVALGLAALLLVATTDPVDLADALVQRWHAPARFAFGALAAFRLLPLLVAELATLRRARRARGVDAGRNPVAGARLAVGLLFALLVQAIRRAVRLAAAMDARGFGVSPERTFARPSTTGSADRLVLLAAVVLAVAAVGISVALGQWRPILA